ncbi:hypothetical protein T484DRAFT_3547045 [Baffinella frigidus]|nr:hypothetical protein T484DRAFT_3547045 [Cryptophyta sp. CCMP2293]
MRGALAAVELGRFEDSVALWLAALKSHPGAKEVEEGLSFARKNAEDVGRASSLLEEGSCARALAYLRAPLSSAPHAPHLSMLMVRALLGVGSFQEAATMCESLRERLGEADIELRFLRGKANFGSGDLDGAVKTWSALLRLDPDHEEAKRNLKLARTMAKAKSVANDLFGKGEVSAAIEGYTAALALTTECDTFNAALLYNRAVAHGRTGTLQDAIHDCCSALDLNPSYTRALLQRARAYSELKEHWEAVADLERALEVEPGQKDVARVQQHLTAARAKLEAEGDDHYAVLGVLPDAEEAAVRKAYKRLALLHHPDKAVGGGEMRARAERRFKRVADAHVVLSDKERRAEYDRKREKARVKQAARDGYAPAPSRFLSACA